MRILTGCLLVLIAVSHCRSQDHEQPVSASSDLASLVAEEAKRGVYVFYTQSFIDKENKRASYRGSVYGAIQSFELKDCALKIEAVIVDKFSGTVGQKPTGQLQDTYRYSASLLLTSEIASGATLVESRPAQLSHNAHSVCDEQGSCNFWWLRIGAKQKIIHEVSTVNDVRDFDARVDHFIVPITSQDAGNRVIERLRAIAAERCH